jgi:hypothetical protein
MKDFCFYTCYDEVVKEMGDGCIKSIRRWYPKADVLYFESPRPNGQFHLKTFCELGLIKGWELLKEYKRIIYVDPDSIMCNKCPDLFDDFDMGVVQNNISVGPEYGGEKKDIYINAGLQICTNINAWEEFYTEFRKRYLVNEESLHTQNSLNYCFHTSKFKYKLLEFPDRTYGIAQQDYYRNLFLKDNELYINWEDTRENGLEKKVCIYHAAGTYHKDIGRIKYEIINNPEARERLRSYTL